MNRRELETLFLTLESTPALLARVASELPEDRVRQRGTTGGFSFVEHVWHLADLEREGYGVRIRRLLSEDEPLLSNFDGERVAHERVYQRRDLADGLLAFTAARTRNLQLLREVPNGDWTKTAEQEYVGAVALGDIPRMMVEHDRTHETEITGLLREIRLGVPPPHSAREVSAVA
ncbi:MAG: DinB family protein [Acidobacteriota bacterium]|nr:DinB family protein [Acidobacteriota bacterium]MDQ5872816.1 DinB family protein [Acidobacteriota bacterium]